eukprot:g1331.t1
MPKLPAKNPAEDPFLLGLIDEFYPDEKQKDEDTPDETSETSTRATKMRKLMEDFCVPTSLGKAPGFRMRIPRALKPEKVIFMPKPATFTPIYESALEDEKCHVASLNAGSDQLFVGGSAINRAFEIALRGAGFDTEKFQDLQRQLHRQASEEKSLDRVVLADESVCTEMALSYLSCRASFADHTVTTCFLHVFEPEKRPMGLAQNAAMVYVVGPRNREFPDAGDFVSKLRTCGKNVVVSVNQYNLKHAKKYSVRTPRIDLVRVCLVSGGIYKHPDVSKEDIASAIMEGLYLNPSAQYEHTPVFEFAYDENVFKLAYDKLWIGGAQESKTTATSTSCWPTRSSGSAGSSSGATAGGAEAQQQLSEITPKGSSAASPKGSSASLVASSKEHDMRIQYRDKDTGQTVEVVEKLVSKTDNEEAAEGAASKESGRPQAEEAEGGEK